MYKESEVAELVGELELETEGKMQRKEQGLIVATTSMPDLAPLFDTFQIRMGELKNSRKYGQKEAQTQCLSYMLNVLYWLRAVKGKPIESVFGFYVCGCRCKDMRKNHYKVGLLKLAAPKLFGDVVEAKRMVLLCDVQDMSGQCLLIQFLQEGKGWDTTDVREFQPPIPYLVVLPTRLWPDDNDNCKLVRHGTLSIVYHGKLADIVKFVGNDSLFKSYLKVEQFLEMIPTALAEETYCYLKMRTKDSAGMNPMDEMREAWPSLIKDQAHGFQETYLFALAWF